MASSPNNIVGSVINSRAAANPLLLTTQEISEGYLYIQNLADGIRTIRDLLNELFESFSAVRRCKERGTAMFSETQLDYSFSVD